jgi:short-subunit dehydrogenase
MSTTLLLGASGGLGSEILKLLEAKAYKVIAPRSSNLNLANPTANIEIEKLLKIYKPNIIINCAGLFGGNDIHYDSIFNVNVKTNWSILKYYKEHPPTNRVKFITIVSSSYTSGRRDYILYAATKAALFNMCEGAFEYFENSNLVIGLVNPGRMRTKMIAHLITPETICLEPADVANKILEFLDSLEKNSYINIKY